MEVRNEMSEIKVVRVKNVIGYCRVCCLRCKEGCKGNWMMVIRKSRDGKKDLWGLECLVKKIRVING